MDRNAVLPILVALIGITAVVLAATAYDTSRSVGSGGGSGISGSDEGLISTPANASSEAPFQFSLPPGAATALGLLFGLSLLLYGIVFWRRAALMIAVGAIAIAVVALLVEFLKGVSFSVPATGGFGLFGGQGEGPMETINPLLPSDPVLVLIGIALAGAAVVAIRSGVDRALDGDDDGGRPPGAAALGRAAGRAADHIENAAPVDNEVYRAWREMTDLLDVSDPASTTPGEFAAAARDAGMAPGDVEELTRLFREVRYGGSDPTDEYERRAVAVLRRIEAEYAADPGGGS